jgi:hypothetical protein
MVDRNVSLFLIDDGSDSSNGTGIAGRADGRRLFIGQSVRQNGMNT